MKFEKFEADGNVYVPACKEKEYSLFFSRRHTWDDGRYLLVDDKRGRVYESEAYDAWEFAETDDVHEILFAVLDVGEESPLLEAYLKAYGDLKRDIVTLIKRLRGAA